MASLFDMDWTNATTGVVIESPWINTDERRVSGCVLHMRWVQGEVFNVFGSARQPVLLNSVDTIDDQYLASDIFRSTKVIVRNRIEITRDVFDAVNIPLPEELRGLAYNMDMVLLPQNATFIENVIQKVNWAKTEWTASRHVTGNEHIVATLFADARARANIWRMILRGPYPEKKPDWKALILAGRRVGGVGVWRCSRQIVQVGGCSSEGVVGRIVVSRV
jgi:hypothetical protein